MGFYIQGPTKGKAQFIVENYSGILSIKEQAEKMLSEMSKAVIVVVDNGPFEAAAFAYSREEFHAFHSPNDYRLKKYVIMDRAKACELTRFNENLAH